MAKKIVILGAGYGGVRAAKLLNKRLKKHDVEINLIDKNPYHTLMTELHEVAGGRVEEDAVKVELKRLFHRSKVNVIVDQIIDVDFKNRRLTSKEAIYEYDYLILNIGSEPAFFGVKGVQEYGFTLWSLEDAKNIRRHIEDMFEEASKTTSSEERRKLLTFVVAGAGFTGVEMAGELAEFKKELCYKYNIDEKEVRVMIVEALDTILPTLNEKLIKKARYYINKLNIELRTSSPIVEVSEDKVVLKNGDVINTKTLIWTCGVQGNSFASKLDITLGKRGRILTNEYMQSVDYDNVYVIGDITYFEEDQKPVLQVVETALQTADVAAENIVADIKGSEKKRFKSNYHGFMVSIGSRYCVATLMNKNVTGFFAMAAKHLVNMHYLFGIGGFLLIWDYFKHHFMDIKNNKSMVGGHFASKTPTFWLVPLRLFIGIMWLIEGLGKVKQGWLSPDKIFIVTASSVSGASQATEAVASASQAVSQAVPLLKQPPEFYQQFMHIFVEPFAYYFQVMVVLAEIGIGLALIAGLFTALASLASIFLCFNFILSAMAGKEILWYIFGAIALLGGAGRSFGLDYYVVPWFYKWWEKTFRGKLNFKSKKRGIYEKA
ncbi:FAD-dependent oxidoreductase [Caloramator australicus]|uniref:NADH:ubiquinone reductase (non-electrogenic) n=1 Tax=Caloramator australicus RC3 TaxID=857293 RepID=I7J604_9CLOT|nr:FAD-dependent oxidoreductase [Caloramator australicus]CCJ34172.1 NADH dehydrogenase [Caloramator australicus RC3]